MTRARKSAAAGHIRAGTGGWSYPPWRETFYPANVPKTAELQYASRQLTAIEINSTFYRAPAASVFAKWHDTVPDDFVFSLKAPRYCTQRKALAEAGESVQRFIDSASALESKLGPIVWQLEPHKHFDADEIDAFLTLLPKRSRQKQPLRHALEVRHGTFATPEFVELARQHEIAIVCVDDAKHPQIADVTADFVYLRLRRCESGQPTGYASAALKQWKERALLWASGETPHDLQTRGNKVASKVPRDVFVYFINGAKERAPAAAMALLKLLAAGST